MGLLSLWQNAFNQAVQRLAREQNDANTPKGNFGTIRIPNFCKLVFSFIRRYNGRKSEVDAER